MRVLGCDPSLTNFGWAIHDTEAPVGTSKRCIARGRFCTDAKELYIVRNMSQRESLRKLLRDYRPEYVGIEYPVFGQMYSEGMYGLFLYLSEALYQEKCDVVFWSPGQIKAFARDLVDRPPKWKMEKPDMVEAAKADCTAKMNHNEADAFLAAVLAGRFWKLVVGDIKEGDLTPTESEIFIKEHTYSRGKKAGMTVQMGTIVRESDRFFRWSKTT